MGPPIVGGWRARRQAPPNAHRRPWRGARCARASGLWCRPVPARSGCRAPRPPVWRYHAGRAATPGSHAPHRRRNCRKGANCRLPTQRPWHARWARPQRSNRPSCTHAIDPDAHTRRACCRAPQTRSAPARVPRAAAALTVNQPDGDTADLGHRCCMQTGHTQQLLAVAVVADGHESPPAARCALHATATIGASNGGALSFAS